MALIYRTQQLTEIWADSGYWSDIQNAVDQAKVGDIVHIPEGTFNFVNVGETWSGYRVQGPAGISIFGAQTERAANGQVIEWKTVLVLPWDMPNNDAGWFRFGTEGQSVSEFTRISDIKLVGYRFYDHSAIHYYNGIRMQNIIGFRVDHCCLQDICGNGITGSGTSGTSSPDSHYMVQGLVDHCRLVNTVGIVAPYDGRTVGYGIYISRGAGYSLNYPDWEPDATKVLGQYTDYTCIIEDCYLSKWRHCVVAGNGGHAVVRHSTIEKDYGYGSLDVHGENGGRGIEIYNCTIIDAITGGGGSDNFATYLRGGSGVAFDNTVGGGTYDTFLYFLDENSDPKYWIRDWYIWNNTMLSGCREIVEYDPEGNITEGVHYFRYAPSWYTPYPYPFVSEEPPPPPENVTPWTGELDEGTYRVTMPSQVQVGSDVYNFKQWEDGSTNPTRTVNLSSDITITATYEKVVPITYTLTITAGAGGTTNPSPNSYTIVEGQQQQVTAIADVNYRFVNWLLDGVSRTENPITVTMNQDHSLEAVFEYVPPPPLKATLSGIIKDSKTSAPIAGAIVTADGYADVTEIDGSYIFQDIPATIYTLTIQKEGYDTQTFPIDTSEGGTFTEDFDLRESAPPPIIPPWLPWAFGLSLFGIGLLYVGTKRG